MADHRVRADLVETGMFQPLLKEEEASACRTGQCWQSEADTASERQPAAPTNHCQLKHQNAGKHKRLFFSLEPAILPATIVALQKRVKREKSQINSHIVRPESDESVNENTDTVGCCSQQQ